MTKARRGATRRLVLLLCLAACGPETPAPSTHERMLDTLSHVRARTADEDPWLGDALARELRPVVAALPDIVRGREQWWAMFRLGVESPRRSAVAHRRPVPAGRRVPAPGGDAELLRGQRAGQLHAAPER